MALRPNSPIPIPDYDPQMAVSPSVPQVTGPSGDAWSQLASTASQLGNQAGAFADQAAQDEGKRAGLVAGLDPNWRPDNDPTIRGRAYDAAAQDTYVNTLQTQTRDAVNDAYTNYMQLPVDQRQPSVLQNNLKQIQGDFEANHVYPQVLPQFRDQFARTAFPYLNKAQADQDLNVKDQARASGIQNEASIADSAVKLAGLGTAAGAIGAQNQVDAHARVIDNQVNTDLISAVQGQAAKQTLRDRVSVASTMAKFSGLPLEQRPAFLDNFQKQYGTSSSAPATPLPVSPSDRDLMIRTVAGEAGGETPSGQAAVAQVIKTRALSGNYGSGVAGVINAPKQFSVWNQGDPAGDLARNLSPDSPQYKNIGAIVDGVMSGQVQDTTGGADHYYNPNVASPAWGNALGARNSVVIGNHRFVGGNGGGPPMVGAANPTTGMSSSAYLDSVSQMGTALRSAQSQAKQAQSQSLSDIGDQQKQIEGGAQLTDATLQRLQQSYGTSGDPTVRQAMQVLTDSRTAFQFLRGLPPEQAQAQATAYRAQFASTGMTAEQASMADRLDSFVSQYRKDMATDPLKRGAQEGMISGLAPLNPAAPIDDQLRTRFTQAQHMASITGDQPKFFSPGEGAQFAQGLAAIPGGLAAHASPDMLATMAQDDGFKRGLTMNAQSTDVSKATAAFSALAALQQQAPTWFKANYSEAAPLLAIWQHNLPGSPESAVEKVQQASDPALADRRERFATQATANLKNMSTDQVMSKLSDREWYNPATWGSSPAAPPDPVDHLRDVATSTATGLYDDYTSAYKDAFSLSGSAPQAEAAAKQQVQAKWGVSQVAGKNLMAYPPERFYPQIAGSNDWMAKQLDDDIKTFAGSMGPEVPLMSPLGRTMTPAPQDAQQQHALNLYSGARRLIADPQTEAEAASSKKNPSYLIAVADPSGQMHMLESKPGQLARWRPNPQPILDARQKAFEAKNRDAAEVRNLQQQFGMTPF